MTERADRIRVHIEGREYYVVGGGFQEMLAAVKQINGRRFVGELKVWQLPGKAINIQNQLDISGYRLEGGMPIAETTATASASEPGPAAGGDRIRMMIEGQAVSVVGGGFQEMLVAVKGLPGRRFNGDDKVWEIPGDIGIIKQLVETAGFQLEGAEQFLNQPATKKEGTASLPIQEAVEPPPFEEVEIFEDDDIPFYEPPDWWDEETMPPPVEPSRWEIEEQEAPPSGSSDDIPFDQEPQPATAPASSGGGSRGADQIRVRVGGIPFVVSGGSFQEMLTAIKGLPGRRFDGEDKVWDIPAEVTIEGLQKRMATAGFVVQRG